MRSVLVLPLLASGCLLLFPPDGSETPDPGFGEDSGVWIGTDGLPPAEWAALEEEVVRLVNEERAQGGLCGIMDLPPSGPLEVDLTLRDVARDYSRRMAEEQFFDHVDPQGSDPFDRMEGAGFRGAEPWGENIAAGYFTPREVVDGWLASPGHCRNLLEADFGVIGVGYYRRNQDPAEMVHYWTQVFAGSH